MPNFKPYGLHWRPCGRIFKFCKFWRKKKEIEPFGVISENSLPKGFFWSNKKTSVISLLSADSRYFRTYALKSVTGLIKVNLTIISTRRVLLRETRSSSNKNVTLSFTVIWKQKIICMYACVHACMHACMHVCMYVCMYVCNFYFDFMCSKPPVLRCPCLYIYIFIFCVCVCESN